MLEDEVNSAQFSHWFGSYSIHLNEIPSDKRSFVQPFKKEDMLN